MSNHFNLKMTKCEKEMSVFFLINKRGCNHVRKQETGSKYFITLKLNLLLSFNRINITVFLFCSKKFAVTHGIINDIILKPV